MPALTIPERYRNGIAAIGTLPETTFESIFDALRKTGQAENATALAAQVRNNAGLTGDLPLEPMITALAAMQEVRRTGHAEPDRFAADLWNALREDAPDLLDAVDEAVFKARISLLSTNTDIHLTSTKIRILKGEVERSFCGVRILTDARAAFSDDASKAPPGLTIIHNLQLGYHDDGDRHREFFVALDDEDLETLKAAIERAQTKRQTLARALAKADLKVFD